MSKLQTLRRLVCAMAMLGVAGCAAHESAGMTANSIHVAPNLVIALPKPATLGRSLEVTQLVTIHYGAHTFVFEGHISATPERVLLVGLDPMGRRALTVTWTEQTLTAQTAPGLPDQLRPENMLADIVLLYWPEASLRQALAGSGGTLTVGPHFRSISVGGKEVIHAGYSGNDPWDGTQVYRNLGWGYELDLQSAESKQ